MNIFSFITIFVSLLVSTSSSRSITKEQKLADIKALLGQELSAYNISDQCGAFYKELDVMTEADHKKIVIIPHRSGLADRFLAVGSVCVMGAITNRTCFVGRRKRLPDLELSFTYNRYNWSRAQDPDWVIDALKEGGHGTFNQTILDTMGYYAVNGIENSRLDNSLIQNSLNDILGGDATTSMISLNRGKTLKLFDNSHHEEYFQNAELNPYTAFGCMINYMFKPKEEIFLPIFDEFKIMTEQDPNILKIGIQVRVGDAFWKNPHQSIDLDQQYYMFFDCAEQIEAFEKLSRNYTKVVWYLLTESKALRKAVLEKYQNTERLVLSATNITIEHTSNEESVCGTDGCEVNDAAFESASAEWWLFPYAQYFVISRFSGYGRSAAMRLLGGNNTIYTINSPRNNGVGLASCEKGQATTLDSLGTDWSGV